MQDQKALDSLEIEMLGFYNIKINIYYADQQKYKTKRRRVYFLDDNIENSLHFHFIFRYLYVRVCYANYAYTTRY